MNSINWKNNCTLFDKVQTKLWSLISRSLVFNPFQEKFSIQQVLEYRDSCNTGSFFMVIINFEYLDFPRKNTITGIFLGKSRYSMLISALCSEPENSNIGIFWNFWTPLSQYSRTCCNTLILVSAIFALHNFCLTQYIWKWSKFFLNMAIV